MSLSHPDFSAFPPRPPGRCFSTGLGVLGESKIWAVLLSPDQVRLLTSISAFGAGFSSKIFCVELSPDHVKLLTSTFGAGGFTGLGAVGAL